MGKFVTCRDVGEDCDFVSRGRSENEVMSHFMEHVQRSHTEDWFELEEIRQLARLLVRDEAA